MKALSSQTAMRHGVMRTLGFGIILCSLAQDAHASNILRGSDYLATPNDGHTSFHFPQIGIVRFKGVPLPGLQGADTIIERLDNAVFDLNGDGWVDKPEVTIPIRMTALSLISAAPVSIQGDRFEVRPTLNSKPSAGTMTIKHNTVKDSLGRLTFNDQGTTQGTFSSLFDVNFDAVFTSLTNGSSFTIPNQSISLINQGANWSHSPTASQTFLVRGAVGDPKANCHSVSGACNPGDFFPGPGAVNHAKGSPNYPDGHGTTVAQIIQPDGPTCTATVSGLAPVTSPQKTTISIKTGLDPSVSPTPCVTDISDVSVVADPRLLTLAADVQQTPGPLPLAGAAASLSVSRTLRKRVKACRI
jgi:hypothetical protein